MQGQKDDWMEHSQGKTETDQESVVSSRGLEGLERTSMTTVTP